MNRCQSSLDDLLVLLVRLHDRCGSVLYERAISAARVSIARVVHTEAERRAGLYQRSGTVIRFRPGEKYLADAGPKES